MTSFNYSGLIRLSRVALILLLSAAGVQAQGLTTPLHIGNQTPIENEFGDRLPGTANQPGALVIGKSVSPAIESGGLFSISLSEPRPASGKVFVRVFNRATLEASSFYADSELFTISGNKEFLASVGSTTNALDTADDDNDGLHNSWEKSYGSDPTNPDSDDDGLSDGDEIGLGGNPTRADTDGDGMIDGHEQRAGTDLADKDSYLGLAAMTPSAQHLIVRWASVPGRSYQVEGAPNLLNPAFSNLSAVITAEPGAETSATITNALLDTAHWILRVRLIEN